MAILINDHDYSYSYPLSLSLSLSLPQLLLKFIYSIYIQFLKPNNNFYCYYWVNGKKWPSSPHNHYHHHHMLLKKTLFLNILDSIISNNKLLVSRYIINIYINRYLKMLMMIMHTALCTLYLDNKSYYCNIVDDHDGWMDGSHAKYFLLLLINCNKNNNNNNQTIMMWWSITPFTFNKNNSFEWMKK